jgi:integrative and conjugative element protein (TIGR02256 family)
MNMARTSVKHWPLRGVHRCGLTVPDCVEDLLRAYAFGAHPLETGGLLLGWWERQVPIIFSAVEVKDPHATRRCWTRDERRAQEALEQVQRLGKHIGYIGDWHSHPADVGPSGSDLRELRRVSRQYGDPITLAVVRHGGPVDVRLALAGRLTTAARLVAGRPEALIPSGDSS